jgi:uncharacterized protein YndB with AHSA1/START domain
MAEAAKLVLTRRLAAAPRDVFEALTTADLLARWFSPRPFHVCEVEAELRVGGKFSFRMEGEPGRFGAEGIYKEIVPDRRLVLTWTWVERPAGDPLDDRTSLVSFDLAPDGDGTILTLTHEQLPDQEQADSHAEGWTEALAKLASLLEPPTEAGNA